MEGSWDEFFVSRKWRLASEVTGEQQEGPASVRFLQGAFTVTGGKFCAPGASTRGSKGLLLQEVASDGTDIDGSRCAVGVVTYRKARQAGAVL